MKLVFAKIFRTVFTKILKNYEAINEAKLPFEETHPISSDNFNLCKKKIDELLFQTKKWSGTFQTL